VSRVFTERVFSLIALCVFSRYYNDQVEVINNIRIVVWSFIERVLQGICVFFESHGLHEGHSDIRTES
jgi:hypothetical protein